MFQRKKKKKKKRNKEKTQKTKQIFLGFFFFFFFEKNEKVHIIPSNYHIIVNGPPKLLIVSISRLKLSKHVNVSLNNKNTLHKLLLIFFLKKKLFF
jgi:hypothetical protein